MREARTEKLCDAQDEIKEQNREGHAVERRSPPEEEQDASGEDSAHESRGRGFLSARTCPQTQKPKFNTNRIRYARFFAQITTVFIGRIDRLSERGCGGGCS